MLGGPKLTDFTFLFIFYTDYIRLQKKNISKKELQRHRQLEDVDSLVRLSEDDTFSQKYDTDNISKSSLQFITDSTHVGN